MLEKFDFIARAVIIKNNKILLCRQKTENYYFFPGGHIEFAEKAELAIARELFEEANQSLLNIKFIGSVENMILPVKKIHEFNLVFAADIQEEDVNSAEDNLIFSWIEIPKLDEIKILPAVLKNCVIKWINDRECFWGSQNL